MAHSLVKQLADGTVNSIDDFVAFHVGAILQKSRADAVSEAAADNRRGPLWPTEMAEGGREACLVKLELVSYSDEADARYD